MSTIEEHIDVAVPVRTAYNQWTQFESFPHFMEGVERIDQLTPTRTHWVTKIAGVARGCQSTPAVRRVWNVRVDADRRTRRRGPGPR